MNSSTYDNNSFTFYGPMEMAIDNDDETVAPEIKIAISIILSIIMIMSIIGNISTCAVIISDRTMRTPTNYYLFNLAVADFSISIFIPIELYIIWMPNNYPLGEIGCRAHLLLLNCLAYVSVLTITVFTVERYLVISKPFLRQTLAKTSRVSKIVLIIWCISLVFVMPEAMTADILVRNKHVYCYTTVSGGVTIFIAIQMFLFFVGPMIMICMLFIVIAVKLRQSKKFRRSPVNGKHNREKAVLLLAAVAASFFFCWFPFFIIHLMMVFPQFSDDDYYDFWRIMNYVGAINGYLSTTVNPILYGLMSGRFRHAFKELFKRTFSSSHQSRYVDTGTIS